jgi:KUP system potassium uptake protein
MALSLGALGVVFGDIGTSPLYTLRECLMAAGGAKASVDDLFGILSLMFWSLIMVVTVKYLTFVMRADHHGEGGIFALLAIVPERFRATAAKSGKVTGMALLAVIGAALLYGDGVITPAISVLSAVEGLAIVSPHLSPIVVPLTCAILVGLFSIQRRGTGDVGKLFGRLWPCGLPCWQCLAYITLQGTLGYWRHFRHCPERRSSGDMEYVVPSSSDRLFWL